MPRRFLWTVVLLLAGVSPAGARDILGVPLPAGAVESGNARFRSPLSYAGTIQWIERELKKGGQRVRFVTSIDLPDVVSSHAAAPSDRNRWSGINVSEYGGVVKIFIIERR